MSILGGGTEAEPYWFMQGKPAATSEQEKSDTQQNPLTSSPCSMTQALTMEIWT